MRFSAFTVFSAADGFNYPTKRINELWQTDFTYFRILNWGWYYLSRVLDDFSRDTLAWKLTSMKNARDVQDTLLLALAKTYLDHVLMEHRPRLLSDNSSCFLSKDLKLFLAQPATACTIILQTGKPHVSKRPQVSQIF